MDRKMFCCQCEQTAGCKSCTGGAGVCGKKADVAGLQDKLTEIIRNNDIKSVTIVRMEVPCCGGLQRAAENALKASGKFIPWQVVTISRDGRILD